MMHSRFTSFRPAVALAVFTLASLIFVPASKADDSTPGGQPSRAVRIGSVDGQVTLAEGDQVLADPALMNTPVFEGTQLTSGADGRVELQFDDGSVARLTPDGVLALPVLRESGEAEIRLDRGMAYFELQGTNSSAHTLLRFGDVTVTASGFTVLRINLDTPPGEVAVFSGSAHLERAGGLSVDVRGGESVRLDPANTLQYNLVESIEPDSWDTWNSDRDQALTTAAANRTGATSSLPNSSAPAWSDLDASGNWYNVPGQGYVWSPYAAANSGWDPWGNGHWMWTPRFGYIWVSGDAWGYMPYSCGAWNYYDSFGWGWMPGSCSPWWGGGVWISTYYNNGPRWYRFPRRPHPEPPRNHPLHPWDGGRGGPAHPTYGINRRASDGIHGIPVQGRNTPVEISGVLVHPLHPLPQRPQYDHGTGGVIEHQPVYGGYRVPQGGGKSPVVSRPTNGQQGLQPVNGGRTTYVPSPRTPSNGLTPSNPSMPRGGQPTMPSSPSMPRSNQPSMPRPSQPSMPSMPRPSQPSMPSMPRSSPAPAPSHSAPSAPPSSGGGGGSRPSPSPSPHH